MNRSFRAFANRGYAFVWMGSMLSNVGNWMENVGQGWVVASQTHSAFLVEFLSFAQFIPVIFLALPAGVLADRTNKKAVLIACQSAMCLIATTLAVLAHMGKATPNLIITITFFEGAAWALNAPSWQAVVPRLVPRHDLESAIALNSIQFNMARLIGPAIAGVVVHQFGFAYAFDLNALSFLAVIFALIFVKFEGRPSAADKKEPSEFKHAFRWVWEHKGSRRIVFSIATFAFFSAPLQGLMPFYASDILNVGPQGLGNLLACIGAGAVTGAFLLGQLPTYYPRHHLIPLAMTALGFFELIYSRSSNIHASYILLYVTGVFWLWTMVSCSTAMQLLVPDRIRGRAMSLLLLANVGTLPLGHLMGGVLAKSVGPRTTMAVTSTVLMIIGVYTLWKRVPEIDGYEAKGHPTHFTRFFSEVILATSHRGEALSLDAQDAIKNSSGKNPTNERKRNPARDP